MNSEARRIYEQQATDDMDRASRESWEEDARARAVVRRDPQRRHLRGTTLPEGTTTVSRGAA